MDVLLKHFCCYSLPLAVSWNHKFMQHRITMCNEKQWQETMKAADHSPLLISSGLPFFFITLKDWLMCVNISVGMICKASSPYSLVYPCYAKCCNLKLSWQILSWLRYQSSKKEARSTKYPCQTYGYHSYGTSNTQLCLLKTTSVTSAPECIVKQKAQPFLRGYRVQQARRYSTCRIDGQWWTGSCFGLTSWLQERNLTLHCPVPETAQGLFCMVPWILKLNEN